MQSGSLAESPEQLSYVETARSCPLGSCVCGQLASHITPCLPYPAVPQGRLLGRSLDLLGFHRSSASQPCFFFKKITSNVQVPDKGQTDRAVQASHMRVCRVRGDLEKGEDGQVALAGGSWKPGSARRRFHEPETA